jgi:hypothetical protein
MAKRLLNSEKNRRAREKFQEKQREIGQKSIDTVSGLMQEQADSWKKPAGAGSDIQTINPRTREVTQIFRPKKGGGGTFLTPDGGETKVSKAVAQAAREKGISLLEAVGGTTKQAQGEDFGTALDQAGKGIGDAAKNGDGIDVANATLSGGGRLLTSVAPWIAEDMGKTEAPRNLGQWLINLLSTGTYVGARAAEGAGAAFAKADKAQQATDDIGEKYAAGAQGAVESIVNTVGGAGRGLAEGFGARFDGQRPRTWGQNLEALGTDDALKGALGEKGGEFTQGIAGFAADVALDPLSWATLGASGAVKGAAKGAAKAASEATSGAGKVAAGTVGAFRGASEGAALRRAEIAQARTDRATARQVRRDQARGIQTSTPLPTPVQPQLALGPGRAVQDAAGAVAPDVVDDAARLFVGTERGDVFEPQNLDLRSDQLALPATASDYRPRAASVDAVQEGARLAQPVIRETDALLPSLSREVTPQLDLGRLLTASRAPKVTKVPAIGRAESADLTTRIDLAQRAIADGGDPERAIRGAMAAIESNPGLAPRMGLIVNDAGDTMGDLVQAAMRGHRASRSAVAKLWQKQVDETAEVVNTPALRAAVDELAPGAREALGIPASRLHKLVSTLNRTVDPTKQQELLGRVFGKSYREGFPTFRDALAAASRGEVDPAMMSRMVEALGIKTKATTPKGIQQALTGRGVTTYEEALAQIPTPEQIRQAYNLTDETAAAAARIDPEAAVTEQAIDADELIAATPGAEDLRSTEIPATNLDAPTDRVKAPKPAVTPQRAPGEFVGSDFEKIAGDANSLNQVGKAAYDGVRALGNMLRESTEGKSTGNTLTSYTDMVSTRVHRAVVDRLKLSYLKKGGIDRAERFLPRYLEAMNVVEAYARSKGMFPHLVDNTNGTGDIWISSTQALELLPEDVVGAALFAPLKNRKTAAAEQGIGYVNGMTLYPNHVMTGLKVALAGGQPDVIARAIIERAAGASRGKQRGSDSYVKAFAEKPEGQQAISDLAVAMTDPGFLDAVRAVDARVKPVAEAISQRHIDNVVARAGDTLMRVLREGGDRGTLLAAIKSTDEWAADAARPALLDADRISMSVSERLNTAVVKGILGEDGFLTAQHDWAFATATETVTPAQRTARQAAELARAKAQLSGQRGVSVPTAGASTGRAMSVPAQRAAVATVAERQVLDLDAQVRAVAQGEVEAEIGRPLREVGDEELWQEVEWKAAATRTDEILSRTSGKHGQDDLWAPRVSVEEGALTQSARYTQDLHKWFKKTARDLSAARGAKVTPQQALDHLNGPIWHALAATDPENWGNKGLITVELMAGRRFADPSRAATGGAPGFAALDETDVRLALELHDFIDHVWNPYETGLAGRSGLTAKDYADASGWYMRGDMAALKVDPNGSLRDQATNWRAWEDGTPDRLDALNRSHQAFQAALVPQQLGHQLGPLFSHKALRPGVPTTKLYAEGWRRIDTENATGIGRFADPKAYFPPEVLEQLRHVDHFLAASRGFDPESTLTKLLIKPFDQFMHVWKSANTIWRAGHHVTNVLGENGMLLMAGVNPAKQVPRALKVWRAGEGALDADMSVLDDIVSDGKSVMKPDTDGAAKIVLKDGRGGHTVEEIPYKQIWEWAVNSGVALTHTAARDMVDELGGGIRPNLLHDNPIAKADEALGRFSAWRDNATRIAHYLHALESGTFANLDQAKAAAQKAVHDYHPTIRTMSRFEQKYARRMFGFYTWVRQAISRVLRTAADQPGFVTMPFKLQYNIAEAQGLNPESIGGPTTDDPRLSTYSRDALVGAIGSDTSFPFNLLSNPQDGELAEDLWSASLSSPQMDTLQTLFGNANIDPSQNAYENAKLGALGGALQLGTDSANPIIATALKWLPELNKPNGKSLEQIVAESGGLPTALARSIPSGSPDPETGQPRSVFSEAFPNSSGAKKEPAEQQEEMRRYLANLLLGVKFQNVTGGKSAKYAKDALREQVKTKLAADGITDSEVATQVTDLIWNERVRTRTRG